MSYNSELQTNNINLQALLNAINALPEAGTDLPELTNEGVAGDLVSGKELIDSHGNIVTGTNPYEKTATDSEVATQTNLLAQVVSALEGKVASGASLPNNISEINTGSFVVASDYNARYEFNHGLSRKPNFYIVFAECDDASDIGANYLIFGYGIGIYNYGSDGWSEVFNYSTNWNCPTVQFSEPGIVGDTTKIEIYTIDKAKLKAGITYHWIAGVSTVLQ